MVRLDISIQVAATQGGRHSARNSVGFFVAEDAEHRPDNNLDVQKQ